ncbi:unnamed protein product [Periconia digitata]|uniref:alpha-1,2-Mannosidase n=1 Tax=Periconia digitata TaxID=1303443 RepID=A0A9W4U4W4_9PLEO|nr:unnamed protein product [Periconia digitata]
MARIRVRHVVFCALLVVFLYHMLPSDDISTLPHLPHSFSAAPNAGTVQLARYMNDPKHVPRIVANQSSFAWNTVELSNPPELTPKLPSPVTQRPRIQHQFTPDSRHVAAEQEKRRQEVLRVTKKAWAGYKDHAWMKDALKPTSGNFVDQFSGWAATLVDSLDTLWIMGLRDEFYEAVEATASIDFGQSTSYTVNTFETNIRYLGGLLAAYDLSNHPVLKAKAVEVGNLLYLAFNTANNMPVDMINFSRAKEGTLLAIEPGVVSASPGTITLEFARLSQITGDSKYYAAVSHVMDVFATHQNDTKLPGMWPMMVDMRTPDVTSGYQFTIGGNADSLYEYLPKAVHLLGSTSPSTKKYEEMSRLFLDTAQANLFFHPMIPSHSEKILISGNVDVLGSGPSLDPESEHLSCFIGGLYALSARIFSSETYLDTAAKLTRGCAYAYSAFPSGVMPERYNMVKCPDPHKPCPWSAATWDVEKMKRSQWREDLPLGFTTAKDPRYILRPEAIESVFIMWRVTGEEEWRDTAWRMFEAVVKATETDIANAAIEDVVQPDGGKKTDYMESFWVAETLKYFYLCFADTGLLSLDEFVLNTEAHGFRLDWSGGGTDA